MNNKIYLVQVTEGGVTYEPEVFYTEESAFFHYVFLCKDHGLKTNESPKYDNIENYIYDIQNNEENDHSYTDIYIWKIELAESFIINNTFY